jgi:hypothetical protein
MTAYQAIISSSTPFTDLTVWLYKIAQHFVNNLAPIVKAQYLAEHTDHNQMVNICLWSVNCSTPTLSPYSG